MRSKTQVNLLDQNDTQAAIGPRNGKLWAQNQEGMQSDQLSQIQSSLRTAKTRIVDAHSIEDLHAVSESK